MLKVRSSGLPIDRQEQLISLLKRQFFKETAKFNFASFCSYVMKDPKGLFWNLKEHHIQWCNLAQGGKWLAIHSVAESSKCLREGTLIQLADGNRKKIEEVQVGDLVICMGRDWKLDTSCVEEVYSNGVADNLLEISTRTGRSLCCTPEHKLFTLDRGWVEVGNLVVGDKIAAPMIYDVLYDDGDVDDADPQIELLGFLLSEGGLTNKQCTITNTDNDIIRTVASVLDKVGWSLGYKSDKCTYNITCGGKNPSPIRLWLEELGLWGIGAHDKFIPECVFLSSVSSKRLFLSALFSGDGTVTKGTDAQYQVSYCTVSIQLAQDLLSLLLHFGILSIIKEQYTFCNGKRFKSYKLTIYGSDAIKRFKDTIFYLYPKHKGNRLNSVTIFDYNRSRLSAVPSSWTSYQNIHHSYNREKGIRCSLFGKTTVRDRLLQIAQSEIEHPQLFFDFVDRDVLHKLATSDIIWDEVVSTKPCAPANTYDLRIKEHHNYVANDIVTHNSSVFSIAYPLWRIGRDANIRIAIISSTHSQARKFLAAIKTYILSSPEYQETFPNVKPMLKPYSNMKTDKWCEDAIVIDREAIMPDYTVQVFGVGTEGILGSRLDLVILDDVLTLQNTATPGQRNKIIEWHDNTLQSRLTKEGQEIVIGNAFHNGDLLHYLAEDEKYNYLKYSVEPEDELEGHIIIDWPEQYPPDKMEWEKAHNPREYNRMRRCKAIQKGELDFAEHIEDALVPDIKVPEKALIYTGVDLSTKKREGTCIIDIADCGGYYVVIDIEYGAWPAKVKAEKINEHFSKYKSVVIAVEDNAMQEDSIDWMNAAGYNHLPVVGVTTTSAKAAELDTLSVELENRNWFFKTPKGHNRITCRCDWCKLINEIASHPNYPTNDGVMAWVIGSRIMRTSSPKNVQIRSFSLDDTDEEEALLKRAKPTFHFGDYYLGNRISKNKGFQPLEKHIDMVKWIKENIDYPVINHEFKPPFEGEEFQLVLNDMIEFCDTLNVA